MKYTNITQEQFIQESKSIRSEIAQLQSGWAHLTNSPIFQQMTFVPSPELYCRFANNFTYLFINEAYAKFFNKERSELIGQNLLSFLENEYHADAIDLLQSLNPDNPAIAAEYTWLDSSSRARWRLWNVRAVFDESDSLLEYHATGRDITEQKEAEIQLKHRLHIEHALAMASKLLISAGEADLDAVLRIIGEAIAVNRVYIFEFYDDLQKMNNIHEWCDDKACPVISYTQNMDTDVFSWGMKAFLQGDSIIISDRDQLPYEAIGEKESMIDQGIYAALLVPIKGMDKNLMGYIGFDDTENCRLWSNEDIECLEMLAEMLGAYWERKNMEKALRASEVKFRTLADTAPALIFVYTDPDKDAPLHYLNNGYHFVSGYNKDDSINKKCWDFVHPDFITLAKERGLARLRGEEVASRYEIKLVAQNGDSRWGDLSVNTIEWEGQPAIMGVIYDITDRKQMEKQLWHARTKLEARVIERTTELVLLNEKLQQEVAERQQAEAELILSENRYRAIIEDQNELVIRTMWDGTITFINEAYCRHFGTSTDRAIGKNALMSIAEPERLKIIEKINSLTIDNPENTHTLPSISADGRICWQEWTGRGIIRGHEIVELQAVGRDISERKMAEEALQRSESNFRKLAETAPALIWIYSEDHLVYANYMLENITGLSKEELYKMNPMDLFHIDCKQQVKINSIARQKGKKIPPYEVSMYDKEGRQMWGYLYADIFEYEGKEAILGIIVEITERKRMEESLLQASKLESLGILAGGIAHDFNNILTVISGNVSLAKIMLNTDSEFTEVLTEVEKAAFQARDLTQQLLTFSKGGAPIKETASIQELLRESASFVLRGSNVNCNYMIADDLWPVSVDKGQINQVINNLIINADQAMPGGGSIQFSAENVSSYAHTPISLEGANYVKISIKDQGIGIPDKHLSRIFDPYFTTKQKGHGLGLATCYSIIKKHDGEIFIDSWSGIGTIVTIYLPAFPDQAIEEKIVPKLYLSGQGKILIMDDDTVVRETLGKLLQRLGYTAGFAADGLNAIHLYQAARRSGEPYDVVLMDLTIAGGMGGKEAVKKLLEIDAQAKVIVSSGYSNDPVMADYKKYGFCGVLPKPYEIQALNKLLYELISRGEAV